jgi:pyridoxal 5'-phosphate synthase pdxT subunit
MVMDRLTVGVLALQGAFAKHIAMFRMLDINVVEVRKPEDLDACDGLVIPGGESTTIFRQINFIKMREKLTEFAKKKPLFGTCAGLILMSKKIISDEMEPLGLLDVSIERNAFGRQAESFQTEVQLHLDPKKSKSYPAIFIRAPRIRVFTPEVRILSLFEDEPILIQQDYHLGATFHPELTTNPAIHDYFVRLVKQSQN